jgi:hypothetical protein
MTDSKKDPKDSLLVRIIQVLIVVAIAYWIFSPSKPKEPVKVDPQDREVAMLMTMIETTARDPSSIKFGKETRFKNAVCIQANGKNGFGGYTGFKEYCSVTQENGTKKITIDGEYQK